MKTVMKFLSLLLCFELVLGPVQGSLFMSSNAYAGECTVAGQTWSEAVGRCLTSYEVLKVNEATASCGDNNDCYKENAKKALADKGDTKNNNWFKEDGKQKGGVTAMNWATVAIPTLIATKVLVGKAAKKKANPSYKCNPPSLLLMYGGAAALAVGEIYGSVNHSQRLKKIEKEWRKTVVTNSSDSDQKKVEATEAQSQAFEFLAQNEDQVAKTAKTKKGFYLAATGLFAAGLASAVVEQIQLGIAKKALNAAMVPPTNPAAAMEAQNKINKLTCFTQNDGRAAKEANAKADQDGIDAETAQKNADTDQRVKDYEAKQNSKYSAMTDDECSKNPGCVTNKNNQAKSDSDEAAQYKKDKADQENRNKPKSNGGSSQTNPNSKPVCLPLGQSQATCKSPCNWYPASGHGYCGASYNPKKSTEKIKRVAAYNISTATDTNQLIELINEFEAIDFENYSKVSYLGDEVDSVPSTNIPLEVSAFIARSLIPEAHAQSTGCDTPVYDPASDPAAAESAEESKGADIMGKAAMALPLVLGLGQIVKGVKFKDGGKPVAAGEVRQIETAVGDKIDKAIGQPYTRMAINGLLGTWMGFASSHMHKQQKISEERAVKLREMKEEFVSANGIMNCSPADRNNSCKPKCFCFTSDNKVNPERSNQPACANELSKMAYDPFGLNSNNDKVCLDQNSVIDPACACRAKRNCMKISSGINMKGFSPGTFKMISTGAGPAQDLMNGNVGGGDIADSAGINAARIRKAAEDMLAKTDPRAAKASNQFADGLAKGLIASAGGLSMGGSSNSPLPSSPAAAAAALDKELKENKEAEITTAGGGFKSAAGYDSKEDMPEFGLNMDQAASQELEIAEVMGQNLDMGNSDINTGSKTNLFEVLSNRYKRSGMRRLFDENNPSPVDAPAKKEIVE
jgi:hypothetical protein